MGTFDLANIQGNVLLAYTHPLFQCVFLRIDDAGEGRRWLGELTDEVTTAQIWGGDQKPPSTVNVMLSYQGLRALGLAEDALADFAGEFKAGMASRAATLGDTGESAPERWEGGLGTADIHAMVAVYALDRDALAERLRRLDDLIARAPGLTVVSRQDGARLSTFREHFGFADGYGQPSIEGNDRPNSPNLPGQGTAERGGRWRPLKPGEFILGYPDEEGVLPPAPKPDVLGRDGTYVVYRKLRQDVGAFRRLLKEAGRHYPGGEERLAAKLIGRWRDGTPVEISPDRPDPEIALDPRRNNDFRYAGDADGLRCPIGAHIRRANPRDTFGFDDKLINRHRIIRRGLPYGEPLPEGAEDDGADRGVVFMCLNASISRQFEFIQAQWFNDGNPFGLGDDKDIILGNHDGTGKMTVEGRPPYFVHPLPRLVTVRGGEYFFLPGIAALRYIASGGAATG